MFDIPTYMISYDRGGKEVNETYWTYQIAEDAFVNAKTVCDKIVMMYEYDRREGYVMINSFNRDWEHED